MDWLNRVIEFVLTTENDDDGTRVIDDIRQNLSISDEDDEDQNVEDNYFSTFLRCYQRLHERIAAASEDSAIDNAANRQFKLCFHERSPLSHVCANGKILSLFRQTMIIGQANEISEKLLTRLFDFILDFNCISQIGALLELFALGSEDSPQHIELIVRLVNRMIEENNSVIRAAIIIERFNIRHRFDSRNLLLELLYEYNLLDIDAYLRLDPGKLAKLDPGIVSQLISGGDGDQLLVQEYDDRTIEDHRILILFIRHLDFVFHAEEEQQQLDVVPLLQRLKATQRKQFVRKIYRYTFDLFKRAQFDALDDDTLGALCPNIVKSFYQKQLSGLFFRFKDGGKESITVSPEVVSEHLAPLGAVKIGSEMIANAHQQVLSLFVRRNAFASAARYAKINALSWNLSATYHGAATTPNFNQTITGIPKSSSAAAAAASKISPEKRALPHPVTVNKRVIIVRNEAQFQDFIHKIKKWDQASLDSEWFNNCFCLRPSAITVSVIQIANDDICFLIDCVSLVPLHHYLSQIITELLQNRAIRKLGYSIRNDFDMIWRSYLADVRRQSPQLHQSTSLSSPPQLERIDAQNVIDLRELYFDLISSSSSSNNQNGINTDNDNRLAVARTLSGLSQLTYATLGMVIDKGEQLSDWSRRPLRRSQLLYAAIDVCCLNDCYRELQRFVLSSSSASASSSSTSAVVASTGSAGGDDPSSSAASHHIITSPSKGLTNSTIPLEVEPSPIREFRCVVDDMLFGIIRYLRICNADTLMVDAKDRDKSVRLALREHRVFITSGQVYDRYRKHFDRPADCVRLSNSSTALEQFTDLVTRRRLIIKLDDLFARCSLCNGTPFVVLQGDEFRRIHATYLEQQQSQQQSQPQQPPQQPPLHSAVDEKSGRKFGIDFEQFGKMKFVHRLPQVGKFYICPDCGHIYWDGCHSSNFVHAIRSLIVDA